MNLTCHARLGETLEQAEVRYGLAKKPASTLATLLVEGAKEFTFEMQGWRIRCGLLRATDGRDYIVREEYTKIWNSDVMKAGGSPSIKDFETEAVLKGETSTGTWKQKALAKSGENGLATLSNQLVHSMGILGTVWVRNDGAEARLTLGKASILLELPQAVKYDAEMKAIKEARARSNVPKF
ncbi:MAG: hypothetical protein ABJF10_11500 [Chthoniobacter sp.]